MLRFDRKQNSVKQLSLNKNKLIKCKFSLSVLSGSYLSFGSVFSICSSAYLMGSLRSLSSYLQKCLERRIKWLFWEKGHVWIKLFRLSKNKNLKFFKRWNLQVSVEVRNNKNEEFSLSVAVLFSALHKLSSESILKTYKNYLVFNIQTFCPKRTSVGFSVSPTHHNWSHSKTHVKRMTLCLWMSAWRRRFSWPVPF